MTLPLFSTALPICMLCVPNSPPMAQNPQPCLGSPAQTASSQRRHPCQQAVVWMTWTSWGRPSCSSHCPRSPNKCGGEGTPWLEWGGSPSRVGIPPPHSSPPRGLLCAELCAGLVGGNRARGRCRARSVEQRGYKRKGNCTLQGKGGRWGSKSCLFQGEETKAREAGRHLSWSLGTARKPSLSCDPDLSATKDSPPNATSPNKGEAATCPPAHTPGPAEQEQLQLAQLQCRWPPSYRISRAPWASTAADYD